MTKFYTPVVVHYNANPLSGKVNCVYKDSYSYIEENQDVAWFNNIEYRELFGMKRSLDKKNKLLAIVRLEYNNKVIRRRYKYDNSLNINPNNVLVLNNKAILLIKLKRYNEALSILNEVLNIDENNITAIENKEKIKQSAKRDC